MGCIAAWYSVPGGSSCFSEVQIRKVLYDINGLWRVEQNFSSNQLHGISRVYKNEKLIRSEMYDFYYGTIGVRQPWRHGKQNPDELLKIG
jgi:hypothetical protein